MQQTTSAYKDLATAEARFSCKNNHEITHNSQQEINLQLNLLHW